MKLKKRLHEETDNTVSAPKPAPEEHLELDDATLRSLLLCYKSPTVPASLDAKIAKALVDLSDVQVKAAQTKIELRRAVVLSLVRVFGFSVFITVMIIILIGL